MPESAGCASPNGIVSEVRVRMESFCKQLESKPNDGLCDISSEATIHCKDNLH